MMFDSLRFFLFRLTGGFVRRPLIPVVLLLMAGSVGVFIEMAGEVKEEETQRLDERLLLAMREPGNSADPIVSVRVEEMARDLTALGGFTILTGVTLVRAEGEREGSDPRACR
jgi:undecaprenyl-diphosphatase